MKILFFLEPAIFRNDPLFLLPHLGWHETICNTVRGDIENILFISSPQLCANAKTKIDNPGLKIPIEIWALDNQKNLSCFNGDKRKYCQDLYAPPTVPIINEYLYSQLSEAITNFRPDIIFTSSENRYLSIISAEISPKPLLIFMEAAPLPQWARNSKVYMDFIGHQSNSLLATQWDDILIEPYAAMELRWAEDFLNQLDNQAARDTENFNSRDLIHKIAYFGPS
jgi:hypothetical protein